MNIYICKICGKECTEFKGLFIHLKKLHKFDNTKCEEYYNDNIKNDTICKLSSCNNKIEFTALKYAGYCCSGHLNTQKKIDKGLNNYKCEICNSYYEKIDSLSRHIFKYHKDISLEDYYIKYMMKPEAPNGKCLECGKELKFISIAKGYQRFCHNSSCNVIWHNKNSDRLQQSAKGIKRARASGDNIPTQLGYWLKKGFSEDEAKDKLKERQSTNTIEKLGEKKWRERQLKWINTLNLKSENEKDRIAILKTTAIGIMSKPERELTKTLFGLGFLTKAQKCLHENNKRYVYDIICKNKLIEFNGDYWHCNPKKYASNFYNKSKKMLAQQIWDNDKKKIEVAESQGYKVMTVWESDWKINKQKCIDECVRFLNDD